MIARFSRFMFHGGQSLTQRSLRAAAWTFAGRGAGQFLRLVSNVILARLLFPEAFGLMAIANVVLAMISLFADTGVRLALIQNPRAHERQYLDTAWIISILRGCGLFAVSVVLAGPAASFYGQPELAGLIRLISVSVLLQGFENPAAILLTKNLDAPRQTALELARQISGAVTTIVLALVMRNVWSLAIGTVVGAVVGLGASYVVKPYRPSWRWDRRVGTELFHFGKFIFVNTLITFCVMNGDRLILGRILAVDDMGYLAIAMNLALVLPLLLIQMCSQVAFPAISTHADNQDFVRRTFLRLLRVIGVSVFPLMAGMAVFGDKIVDILYEPRYATSGWALQWLGIRFLFFCIAIVQGSVFLAIGRPVFETLSFAAGLVVMIATLPLAGYRWGLEGAVIAICVSGIAIAAVGSFWIVRAIGVGVGPLARMWGMAASILACMWILRQIVERAWPGEWADYRACAVAIMAILAWYWVWRDSIRDLLLGKRVAVDTSPAPRVIEPAGGD